MILYKQFNFGLASQTFGLVTSSNSLPEGQPLLFIFVSPCCHLGYTDTLNYLSTTMFWKNLTISGPKRSIKISHHFTRTLANVIHCITCTLCKKLYIAETGRRQGDRFREHVHEKFTIFIHLSPSLPQAPQTLFVIYIRDSVALRFEPFKRMYENGSKIALNSACSKRSSKRSLP